MFKIIETVLYKYKNNITNPIIEKSVIKTGNEFYKLKLNGINAPLDAIIKTT